MTGSQIAAGEILMPVQTDARLSIALRELCHRCKNDLQTLAALIDLEILQHPQGVPVAQMERLHTYVHTVSLLYTNLMRDPLLEDTGFSLSTKRLLEPMLTLRQQILGPDILQFSVDDIPLSARVCKALTLICAELVCNAQKHGSGRIDVYLRTGDEQGELQVWDQGPGFPSSRLPRHGEQGGIGLEIIESMCRQDMGGHIHYSNHRSGGQVTVTFPLESRFA